MRVTIIKKDGFVSVDGVGFAGLDLSFLPETVHAVQWYGTVGEVEMCEFHPYKTLMAPSLTIYVLDDYQQCLDLWNSAKTAYDTALLQAEAAQAAELARLQADQAQQNKT